MWGGGWWGDAGGHSRDEGRRRGGKAGPCRRGCCGKHANPANFASGPLPQRVYPGRKEGIEENQPEGRHWALDAGCARTSMSSLAKHWPAELLPSTFLQFTSVSQLRDLSGNTKHPRKYIGL